MLADPELLKTLPKNEYIGGLAECIKHEIIRDADGFTTFETSADRILQLDLETVTELIAHNVRIKAKVVEADPLENGQRAHLNFGHTFAHAIERVSNHSYTHGHAVALGMVAATVLARNLRMLNETPAHRIIKLIARVGLPTGNAKLNPDEIVSAMSFDKKVKSSRIRFILPDKIGNVVIRDDIPPEDVLKAVRTIVE